ncbi:MAG: TetR/AcrR family transcriptional regulator [Deltaproteobacteria bacterium]|nr:TetR/AcrR family transcriptional regulator [Deltaproteobacteria bacterium]
MFTQDPPNRQARRESKRSAVLSVARSLLASVGYEDLSLRAVARGAGISPAGMYELFESKEALLDAMGAASSAAMSRSLRAAARTAAAPCDRVVAIGLAYVRFARRQKDDFLSMFTRSRSPRRSLDQDVPADSPYALMRSAVAELLDPKTLQRADPRTLEGFTYGFWSLVHGMAMLQLTTLAGFHGDFDEAGQLVLRAYASSLSSWKPRARSAKSRCK